MLAAVHTEAERAAYSIPRFSFTSVNPSDNSGDDGEAVSSQVPSHGNVPLSAAPQDSR